VIKDQTQELTAVTKTYDLVKWLIPTVQKYPRDYRFSLGEKTESAVLNVLMLLLDAKVTRDKAGLLTAANRELEKTRWLIRLAKDFNLISLKQYEFAAQQMIEVGQQIGGWRKYAIGRKGRDEDVQTAVREDRQL
jgi:hypothetical protein